MYRTLSLIGLLSALFLTGCSTETTMPAEPAPNFTYNVRAEPAVIRESDHCFISSIDGDSVTRPADWGIYGAITYHQFEISPGAHQLKLNYFERSGRGTIHSTEPITINVKVGSDHTYAIESNKDVTYKIFFSVLKWHPRILDDESDISLRGRRAAESVSQAN
jgi:hypothetical protein